MGPSESHGLEEPVSEDGAGDGAELSPEPLRVSRLDRDNLDDFFLFHGRAPRGHCFCVAWWSESWESFSGNNAEQNRALRKSLFERGERDGYLLYLGDRECPVGWCQVGPRSRWPRLQSDFGLEPDEGVHAITCFEIATEERRRGRATFLLSEVLNDLATRGVKEVEAYPRHFEGCDASSDQEPELAACDLWAGPEELYLRAGFVALTTAKRPSTERTRGPQRVVLVKRDLSP